MTSYFITRHAGAIVWARRRGIDAVALRHLDPSMICAGDTVIGTLPVHLAAEICARGARFLFLRLDLPEAMRGLELTADDMEACGATLVAYEVRALEQPD